MQLSCIQLHLALQLSDQYFRAVSELDKEYIVAKILDDVKGRMLEDIVLLETYKSASTLLFSTIVDMFKNV